MRWLYLGCLLFSTFGMCMLDLRYRLFWFAHWHRAALVHGFGVVMFLLWDVAGILTGSFSQGDSPYFSGISIAPEMPLEEPFFLFFLCWITMNVYCGSARLLAHLRTVELGHGSGAQSGTVGTVPASASRRTQPGRKLRERKPSGRGPSGRTLGTEPHAADGSERGGTE